MSLRCFIVDDDYLSVQLTEKAVLQTPNLSLVGHSTDPIAAYNDIIQGRIVADIVFLDIDMPELNGLKFAGLIQGKAFVIFITSYPSFGLQAFENAAIDYLVKPFSYDRFVNAINKVELVIKKSVQRNQDEFFFIKSQGKMHKVYKSQVIFAESVRNTIRLFLRDNIIIETLANMDEIMATLGDLMFMRVHHSFIVNLELIKTLEGNILHLVDRKEVPIGRTYKARITQYIEHYLGGRH